MNACKGMNCGCTDGVSHSLECHAEHAASIAGGFFVKAAKPATQGERAELVRELRNWGAIVINAGQNYTAELCGKAAALLSARPARVEPLTHVGYFNRKYGAFFKLTELAHSERNSEMIAIGEIVKVFAKGIGKDQA